MGKPCVAGCESLAIDLAARTVTLGSRTFAEGDPITLDGSTGEVYAGSLQLRPPAMNDDFETVVGWADAIRRLEVWANADTPDDARRARAFGAQGIGLCRTEHMFMSDQRLPAVRRMILATDEYERDSALKEILPMQQDDFEGILREMSGLPVTIRLLDPPLHEFLPALIDVERDLDRLRVSGSRREVDAAERLLGRVKALSEANPMLGTRGCRLGLLYPEIYEMQVRAIVRAALAAQAAGHDPKPQIMIPLVGFESELERMRQLVESVVAEELEGRGDVLEVPIGTMIELPRAAVRADEIARHADFFSFGTNDLTQTTLGLSRDDAEGKFLAFYVEEGLLPANPFATLDIGGVGDLVKLGCERGRSTNSHLHLGVCGEHGGDPRSVAFFDGAGVDYVSCSPFRVPIARLAAAQATLGSRKHDR
jgi:pyruvate,orthophosphate dikinase